MKSLNEQIQEVMQGNASKAVKTQDLIKIGVRKTDIENLFRLYQADKDEAIAYTLGIEIECYNVNADTFIRLSAEQGVEIQREDYNHGTRKHYKIVRDSSIQGDNALECVSPILKGKTGLTSLKKVCDCLNQSGAQVNKSTGLHVHVGLQNISFEQYRNIFINYFYLESTIDKFMANSRRGDCNFYCKSNAQNAAILRGLLSSNDKGDIARVFNSSRYHKVNPVSYQRHNTIEFRQHQGTTEYTKIEMWTKFVCRLIKWSKNNRLDAAIENIEEIPFLNSKEKTYFINRASVLS